MEDTKRRCAIFCIAEIPPSILDTLLEDTRDARLRDPGLYKHEDMNTAEWFVLMTTKDLSAIHHGMSPPVQPFISPFVGQSIEEVAAWFDANITQPDRVGYMKRSFIVLDTEAVEDEICRVAWNHDAPVETLRCDFSFALENAGLMDIDVGEAMEESILGRYKRSGVAMTKENFKLAQDHGMYLDGMEVKVDEEWRDFRYY